MLRLLFLGLLFSAATPLAEAKPCLPGEGSVTKELTFQNDMEAEARRKLAEVKDENVRGRTIAFVIANPTAKTVRKIVLFELPAGENTYQVDFPKEILAGQKKGEATYTFDTGGNSAYIFSGTLTDMRAKTFKAVNCEEARKSNHYISGENLKNSHCQILDLVGIEKATLIYDQASDACDEFLFRSSIKHKTTDDKTVMDQLEKDLNKKFGQPRVGPNRSLAFDKEATQVLPKKSNHLNIGDSQPGEKGKTKSASGLGKKK